MTTKLILTSLAYSFLLTVSHAENDSMPEALSSAKPKKEELEGARDDWDMTKGWKARVFQPSVRIYFDTGSDDSNEIDLYNDGNLVPTINLLEMYRPVHIHDVFLNSKSQFHFGPAFGFGISAPAEDGDINSDGEIEEASDSPVLMLTAGALAALNLSESTSLGIESGFALGISADEGIADCSDLAFYVGLALRLDF